MRAPWTRLADTTDRAGRLSKELGTITPYDLPWRWADALNESGHKGLRYWLRLDPGAGRGLALFGRKGVPDDPPALRDTPATRYLDDLGEVIDVVEPSVTFDQLTKAELAVGEPMDEVVH